MDHMMLMLQHADSSFPSGSFAFSNGFEGLLARRPELDAEGLADSLIMVLRHRWAHGDRVAVVRAHRAGGDLDRLGALDREVEAAAVWEPIRTGSRRNGAAFLATHVRIGTPGAKALRDAVRSGRTIGHLPVAQGFIWRSLGMAETSAVAVSGYSTAAALTTACVRLGRIGAIQAQRALASALRSVATLATEPVASDAPLSSFVPYVDIVSIGQASTDAKLFVN